MPSGGMRVASCEASWPQACGAATRTFTRASRKRRSSQPPPKATSMSTAIEVASHAPGPLARP